MEYRWLIEAHSTVTVSIRPDVGYQFTSGTLKPFEEPEPGVIEWGDPIGVTPELGAGNAAIYTFTMPDSPIVFSASFEAFGAEAVVAAGVEGLVTDAAMTDVDPSALDPAYGGSPLLTVAPGDAGAAASAFEAALLDNGLELGGYLDLTLEQILLQGTGDLSDRWTNGTPVTQLGAPATVTLDLADALQGHDEYWVLREHGGDVDVLPADYLGGALTFETDQFSTYAIAYKVEDEPGPAPELTVTRVAGENRYDTNYKLVKETHMAGQPIFVATGSVFADALSAGPAAAAADSSIVLAPKSGMTSAMLDLLQQQKPSHIYVIGGKSAVSVKAETQLKGVAPVIRVGGKDRYETSLKIFQQFFAGHTFESGFVATGVTFPDALSASAAAGALGAPVLLVKGTTDKSLMPQMATGIKDAKVESIHIVGGTSAVNQNIETSLKVQGFKVGRLSGEDRYETNMAVNDFLNGQSSLADVEGIWIATGLNFPDALSAAVPAGEITQRLVLSNGNCIAAPVVSRWINGPGSQVSQVTLVGGTAVLKPSVEQLTECTG